jgi:hypothetical protein
MRLLYRTLFFSFSHGSSLQIGLSLTNFYYTYTKGRWILVVPSILLQHRYWTVWSSNPILHPPHQQYSWYETWLSRQRASLCFTAMNGPYPCY